MAVHGAVAPPPRFVPVPCCSESEDGDDYTVRVWGREGETIASFTLTPEQEAACGRWLVRYGGWSGWREVPDEDIAAVGLTREQVRIVYAAERQALNDMKSSSRWPVRSAWMNGWTAVAGAPSDHEQAIFCWPAAHRPPRTRRVRAKVSRRGQPSRSADDDPEPDVVPARGGAV
jgi:hypothetical protein